MPTIPTLGAVRAPLVDEKGMASRDFLKKLQEWDFKLANIANQLGVLQGTLAASTIIQGHAGTIGTVTQNVDGGGIVTAPGVDFTRAYTNKALDNIPDGPATYARPLNTELAQGKIAQLQATQINTSAGAVLSQSGTTATINVAAFTNQYGTGQVNYNSGSVNAPSNTSVGYVYANDPNRLGGAVAYQFTTNYSVVFANQGNLMVGKITLAAGGGGSGGGGGGGNNNVCFSPGTRLMTPGGSRRISEFTEGDEIETARGFRRVAQVVKRDYKGAIYLMDKGEMVTPNHLFLVGPDTWLTAELLFRNPMPYKGPVWNLEVSTDAEEERNYRLRNGRIVHNFLPVGC